jgi:hypothetical protein
VQNKSARHAAHSAVAIKPSLRKIKFNLNRWLAKSPTHTNQYFLGLTKTGIKHEGLYIEKTFESMLDRPPCICVILSNFLRHLFPLEKNTKDVFLTSETKMKLEKCFRISCILKCFLTLRLMHKCNIERLRFNFLPACMRYI